MQPNTATFAKEHKATIVVATAHTIDAIVVVVVVASSGAICVRAIFVACARVVTVGRCGERHVAVRSERRRTAHVRAEHRWIGATALATLGVLLLGLGGAPGSGGTDPVGVLGAVGAGASSSDELLCKLWPWDWPSVPFTCG